MMLSNHNPIGSCGSRARCALSTGTKFLWLVFIVLFQVLPTLPKGLFTRCNFDACDKVKVRHDTNCCVNQTYNSLTTPKLCLRPVVSLSHATKSFHVNRPKKLLPNV